MPPKLKPASGTLPKRYTRSSSSQAQQSNIVEKVDMPSRVVQTAKMAKEAKALQKKEKEAYLEQAMQLLAEKEEQEKAEANYQQIHGDRKPLPKTHPRATAQDSPQASTSIIGELDFDSGMNDG
jgi:hypothetical protein